MKTYTFWQLAIQYKIEIPIIQRDYAQGRCDNKSVEIRGKFLDDLLDGLINYNTPLELDFVYGKVKDDNFIPIDGQQRLTTLFLLHWYIAVRLIKPFQIKGFSYKTRISARDFCNCLIDINKQLEVKMLYENFSDNIKNTSWFFLSWQKDPTVQSMLNMLDAIHEKFKDTNLKNIWNNLSSPNYLLPSDNPKLNSLIERLRENKDYEIDLEELKKQPNISFKFLNLEDFKLTDELYLKMNARGRALSDFESFKAWMIGNVDSLKEKDSSSENFSIKWESQESNNNHWHYLMDKDWADWLWINRDLKIKVVNENPFDKAGINFVKNIAFINHFLNRGDENAVDWKIIYDDYLAKNDLTTFYASRVYDKCFNSIEKCELLFASFKVLSKKQSFLNKYLPESWGDDNEKLSESLLRSSTLEEKCYLYAIVQFYANDIDRKGFDKWFRVIRNLIENTDFNSDKFQDILISIKHLANPIVVLVKKLGMPEIKGFEPNQKNEEIVKLKLIVENESWENEIIEAENHPLFRGKISFLLSNNGNDGLTVFKRRKNIGIKIFNANGDGVDKDNRLLIRSMLSESNIGIGDFPICLDESKTNWVKLLNKEMFKQGIIKVIDKLEGCISYNDVLNKSISDYTSNDFWQLTLVKNQSLLNFSETGLVKYYWNYLSNNHNLFLFAKTKWTEGNILLDNNDQNLIISSFLNKGFILRDVWRKVQADNNIFFKGGQIELYKTINDKTLILIFKIDRLYVSFELDENKGEYTLGTIPNDIINNITATYPIFFN